MKLVIVAVGQKIPNWAQQACDDYLKRFTKDLKLELVTVKTESRQGGKSLNAIYQAESQRIQEAIAVKCNKNPILVILDERGTCLTTSKLSERLVNWQQQGKDVALVIGGPDGISEQLKQQAMEKIRLSDLTLPHALARVVLIEQLYRSWSILANHPYHRE